MEIINPEEEPLDWEPGGKKRRPDKNPWQPDKQFPDHPYPGKPYPPDDDPWPNHPPLDPIPYDPPGDPDPHKRWEKPGKKTCPGCGGTGEVHEEHNTPWYGGGGPKGAFPTSAEWRDTHRGQQYGRKGHFGAGTGSNVQG